MIAYSRHGQQTFCTAYQVRIMLFLSNPSVWPFHPSRFAYFLAQAYVAPIVLDAVCTVQLAWRRHLLAITSKVNVRVYMRLAALHMPPRRYTCTERRPYIFV